jgi:RNA polymerase sigma-70 factor, ECF subfamily
VKGTQEGNRNLRLKHIAETTQLPGAGTIGMLHAFKNVSSGGIDKVESRLLHIRDEYDPAILANLASIGELQDAVSRYLPALRSRAYRYVGNAHDAEDAVQDALLSACKHLDQFKATAKMTTWLTTIVTNSALTQLRRRPRHSHMSLNEQLHEGQDYFLSDTLADARPTPEDECASSQSHGFLMQFLSELSPSLQQAVELRYLDGLSISEAARILEVPAATMKARLWRARAQLKRKMNGL